MPRYPLLFGFRDLVAGNGFIAGVRVDGRALMVEEDEADFWMYGVTPGAIAAGGRTPGEAQAEFRLRYRSVLYDIASEAKDFGVFRAEVERFFREVDETEAAAWEAAVHEVRQGRVSADWLPRGKAESRFGIEVVELKEPAPSMNLLDQAALAA